MLARCPPRWAPGQPSGRLTGVSARLAEDRLGPPGLGHPNAPVNRQRLSDLAEAGARVTVPEAAAADAFQRPCFLQWVTDAAGDGQCLVMALAGVLAFC